MCWLVVGKHKVDNVTLCSDEHDLKYSIVRVVEDEGRPEEVQVSRKVDEEVEELAFEGNT